MTLGQLIAVLMKKQPLIIFWEHDDYLDIQCTDTDSIPETLYDEIVRNVWLDEETKLNDHSVFRVELKQYDKV